MDESYLQMDELSASIRKIENLLGNKVKLPLLSEVKICINCGGIIEKKQLCYRVYDRENLGDICYLCDEEEE